MNGERNILELNGCSPVPLANYLKALGILRLVTEQAEQADPEARGYWKNDVFTLITKLDREELKSFFLDHYSPSPIIAPWNGGSGFNPKDNKTAITQIRNSRTDRLERFCETISAVDAVRDALGITGKATPENKETLLDACRSNLPEHALEWLDAAFVLTDGGAKYPPLLGTGGNDGRLDFTNNYMQRICDVINPADGMPRASSIHYIGNALFGEPVDGLIGGVAIGQFSPTATGGANASTGFDSDSVVNPWDYILMMEGALLFAASCVKKLEGSEPGLISAPFSVRQAAAGYGSSSQDDEKSARAELWVPLWERPAHLTEVRALMSEGRANVKRRAAKNGVDFARAIASLGIDRGISSFQRYGFLVRNGLSYFATPLDRYPVHRQPQVDLLYDIDTWLSIYKGKTLADTAPASAGRALRNLEGAIISLCKCRGALQVQEVLIALGDCEKAMATSSKWTETAKLKPVPPLSPRWLKEADDGSPEYRLAASVASVYGAYKDRKGHPTVIPVRYHLEPVNCYFRGAITTSVQWNWENDHDVVWSEGDLVRLLNNILGRRLMKAQQSGLSCYPDNGSLYAHLGDISDFIEGNISFQRMTKLLWGLILIDWRAAQGVRLTGRPRGQSLFPGTIYGIMKLCFAGGKVDNTEIPLNPQIHQRAANGDAVQATALAARRLHGSGFVPAISMTSASPHLVRRAAAAVLFPLNDYQRHDLVEKICRPQSSQ